MKIDYESKAPQTTDKQRQILGLFNTLNRQRIELRPIQRRDIREEAHGIDYPMDWLIWIIEHLDHDWLEKAIADMKKRAKR